MQNFIIFSQNTQQHIQEHSTSNAGAWALEQNLAYAIFIDIHKKSMTSKKKMREMQFYDKLSAFIQTRTSSQSRSHHQKMFDKFKYISKIVELFKSEIGVQSYKAKYFEGIEKMKVINDNFSQKSVANFNPGEENGQVNQEPPFDVNSSFSIGINMVQVPLFYNNLFYWGGVPEVYSYQSLGFPQNLL